MRPEHPRAYFLTWTCYGERVHGDSRGTVDRHRSGWDTPAIEGDPGMERYARFRMSGPPMRLTGRMRDVAARAIEEACFHRGWELVTANVRSNHVHVVVTALAKPEYVMTTLKAWCTRHFIEEQLVARGTKVWARHGSTRYLWDDVSLSAAFEYVKYSQDQKGQE